MMTFSSFQNLRNIRKEVYAIENKRITLAKSNVDHSKEIDHLTMIKTELEKEANALEKELLEWLDTTEIPEFMKEGIQIYYFRCKSIKAAETAYRGNLIRDLKGFIYKAF